MAANPFRRGKPRSTRPMVASAAPIKIGDHHEAERIRKLRQAWQADAAVYADAVGEIRYPLHFMAAQTTRIRLYPALIVDPDEPPVPLHEVTGEAGVTPELIATTQADLDRLGRGQIGLRPILSALYLNSKTTGEMWLCGYTDPEDHEERWEVRSIDEVFIDTAGNVWLRDDPSQTTLGGIDGMRPFPVDGYITRIWRPHWRYRGLADSPMRSILDSCEELLLASRDIRASFRSRLAGNGLALLSQDISLPGANPTDDDPESDPVFEALTQAILTPIQDEGSAAAVVPVWLRVPHEQINDAFKHFTLDRPMDDKAPAMRSDAIGRVATGMDWPKELVTGIADMNHWSSWFVDETTFKGHVEPDVIVQCDELTVSYARPMLTARDQWDPDLLRRIVYWYDPTELTTKPDLSGNATTAVSSGAAGRASLRKHLGLTDDDKPDQLDEVLYALPHLRGVDPRIALSILTSVAPDIEWPDPETLQVSGTATTGTGGDDEQDGGGSTGPVSHVPGPPPMQDEAPSRGGDASPPAQAASAAPVDSESGTPDAATGAMVAFFPTADQAAQLAIDGGEPVDQIHVTLAYLGDAADLTAEQLAALGSVSETIAGQYPPLEGEFGGIGRFTASESSDGLDPVYASVDVPHLASLRDQLCQHLAAAGVPMPSEHGFTPHATIAYVDPDAEMPAHRLDPVLATFGALTVVLGGDRTDYQLTGQDAPLVAAGRRDIDRYSRQLLDIDRQLRARLITAADAAVRRVLERAGARLRAKVAKNPQLRAQTASVTNTLLAAALGPDQLELLGVTADHLTAEDWSELQRQWEAWVRRAQKQARHAARKMANTTDDATDVAAMEDVHERGLEAGWSVLAAGLSSLVAARLFNPHPDAPAVGEYTADMTVPVGLIRQAMAAAGGQAQITVDGQVLPAGTWGVGQGSAVQDFLQRNSMQKISYEWSHGDTDQPLPAHEDLDGYQFTSWDDPGLVNNDTFPEVEVLAPGDHDGCSCDAAIEWAVAQQAVAASGVV